MAKLVRNGVGVCVGRDIDPGAEIRLTHAPTLRILASTGTAGVGLGSVHGPHEGHCSIGANTIYSSLKSFADYFSSHERDAQQVVLLKKPDSDIWIIGLVTRQNLSELPLDAQTRQHVAVYLPMGYMTLENAVDRSKPAGNPDVP